MEILGELGFSAFYAAAASPARPARSALAQFARPVVPPDSIARRMTIYADCANMRAGDFPFEACRQRVDNCKTPKREPVSLAFPFPRSCRHVA